MADVITRLRVESSEYDNKLRRATEQMQRMEQEVRRTGATFEIAEKEELDFIRSLGQMETKATSAKGKVAELTNSFTELSLMYKRMSDLEKQSDTGKALRASLDQMKGRISEAQADLKNIQGELGGTSNVLSELAGKFGVSTQMLTGFGAAAAAAAGTIKVATDALKSNEEMLDDWKAATESAQSVYSAFLDSLNTGDISGFLSRIREIINAASDAYDALDRLGTFNAFNQINVQKAQTRFTETFAGYRSGESTKSDVQQAAENWKNELETRRKMEQEAYLAKIREIAQQRGVDADALTKALSGSYGSYESLKALGVTGSRTEYRSAGVFGDQMVAVEVRDFANEEERLGDALRRLTDTELESLQGLGAQAERTATEIAQIDKQVSRLLNGRGGAGNTPKGKTEVTFAEGSIGAQEQLIADLQKKWKEAADDDSRAKIKTQIDEATAALDRMTGKVKTSTDAEAKAMQVLADAQERLKAAMQGNDLKTIVSAEADVDKALKALNELRAAKPENQKATYTVEVNEEQLQKLQQLKTDDQTIRVNVEQGEVSLPDMPEKTYTVTIEAETADAISQVDVAVAEMNAEKVIIPVEVQEVEPVKVDVSYTEANMQAFISSIRQQIAEADMGSELYNNLTAKLADATALSNIIKTAIQNGIDLSTIDPQGLWQQIGGGNIDLGLNVPDSAWAVLVDEINTQLAKMGIEPIQLNFKTGNLEKVKTEVKSAVDEMKASIDALGSGVGAISTLGNAFDDLKNIGEDLADAFSGEMDAWDSLMTVFNSGIGVMETVVGVMEAINTLKTLSIGLSQSHGQAATTEAAQVVAGKAAETTAEVAETAASATSTGVSTGEAVSKAADSVAGIPVVGPVLAVAAAASVLAAILSSVAAAKASAGKYAEGGIIPGTSFSGDKLTANVNSGELILNRAQQNNIAAQLTAGGARGSEQANTPSYVSGENIVLGVNAHLRRAGQGEIVTTAMLKRYGIIQ